MTFFRCIYDFSLGDNDITIGCAPVGDIFHRKGVQRYLSSISNIFEQQVKRVCE